MGAITTRQDQYAVIGGGKKAGQIWLNTIDKTRINRMKNVSSSSRGEATRKHSMGKGNNTATTRMKTNVGQKPVNREVNEDRNRKKR